MGIITISRGSYSRGREIAQKLSNKLGYECISREMLLNASKDFNIPEIQLTHANHNAPSVLDHLKDEKKKYTAFIREAFLEYIQRYKGIILCMTDLQKTFLPEKFRIF